MTEKSLQAIRAELVGVVMAKTEFSARVLPSSRDEAISALNDYAGMVLAGGGAERLLQLVDAALARGES